MFLQSCRWKWKDTTPRYFFKLSKKIYPIHNLATFCKLFLGENKGPKQQHYKKLKQLRYFNIINIAECWRKIGCFSNVLVINQSWITQYPVATFSQMFPNSQVVYGQLAMSLSLRQSSVISGIVARNNIVWKYGP